MKITCVMACRDEEQYLPYSLASLRKLPIDELVVVLDRCRDGSRRLIENNWHGALTIFEKEKTEWQNPCAEAKQSGLMLVDDGLVFMTDADMLVSDSSVKKAREFLERNKSLKIICFIYNQYSLGGSILNRIQDELCNFYWFVSRKLAWQPGRSGIYMARSEIAELHDEPSEYDSLMATHKTVVVKTNFLHLRPRYSRKDQIARGKARAHMPQYSLFKVLVTSFLTLQPHLISGYLNEKRGLKQ